MSDEGIRLQKALAEAGLASRRVAEDLIAEGRVEVNGDVAILGRRVDPDRDVIRVDGARVPTARQHRYVMLNKPRGVVTTMDDPQGRRTVAEFMPRGSRLFYVGRLDVDTSGLLLLTNDGELANRLTHPKYEVPKTYVAAVEGHVNAASLQRLRGGVTLDDGPLKPDSVKVLQASSHGSLLRITLHEGRNRVVRRLLEAVGHPVIDLSRVALGPVRLGTLQLGETRDLTREELGALLDAVGM
ncbi:MAG: rRNA pseudouridine synthase [Propionibacteriaceae bacterium]|nr:rRNA pseudouridine synthase [Propionibacteriaceae bacterium]